MDKNVADASWPEHLVEGYLDRVKPGHVVVCMTRMDLLQVSTTARMIIERNGGERNLQISPYQILTQWRCTVKSTQCRADTESAQPRVI